LGFAAQQQSQLSCAVAQFQLSTMAPSTKQQFSPSSADAYGTFNAASADDVSAPSTTRSGRVLRTAGAAGLLMVLAAMGYVHDRSSSSPAVELQSAISNNHVAHAATQQDALLPAVNLESVLSSVESKFVNGIDKTKLREHLYFYSR
jgi:hypothetical protein